MATDIVLLKHVVLKDINASFSCVLKVVPPVDVRSHTFKSEFAESENLKYKLESRDEDLMELKKQLKLKVSALRHLSKPFPGMHVLSLLLE